MSALTHPQREPSLAEQIAQVERRLELRRERTMRHLAEARTDVDGALRWLPLVGVVGALVVGVIVGRRPAVAPHAVAAPSGATSFARTGLLATIVGLAGTALRIALSPQARALWAAYRDRRSHSVPR